MDDFNKHKQEAREAFDKAVTNGRLSENKNAPNYAGNYMYMGQTTDGRGDAFKHIETREYIAGHITEAEAVKIQGRF